MLDKVSVRTFVGVESLEDEAKSSNHSKTTVLDFLNLQFSKDFGVVSESQGVERTTGVEAVETFAPLEVATVVTVTLNSTHKDDLDDEGDDNVVGVDDTVDAEVLDTFVIEDLGTSLEPRDVAGVGRPFRDEAAESTQHSPASVDEFELTVLGESLRVSRETSGIPTVVTGVFTLEVGDVRAEGAEELGAVRAIPFDLASLLGLGSSDNALRSSGNNAGTGSNNGYHLC